MTYQNIRFIAYTIDTMPEEDNSGNETYLGVAAATGAPHTADINARCDLMQRAIQTAAANLPSASPPVAPGTLLNVFMAPEFFFRGPLGAYSMDEVQLVTQRLQAMVCGAEWKDWLFVFGSILGVSAPTFATPPYNIDPSKDKEVYNFTLTQLGGTESTSGVGANAVVKELQSTCDFIASSSTPGALLTANTDYIGAGASGIGREQQQLAYDGAAIFQQAGLTWGLEICLDHYSQRRDSGRLQRSPQLPGEQQIQVQLVPAGGKSIRQAQTMAMPGGFIFNCDGANGSSAALMQVDARGLPPTYPLTNIPPSATNYPVDASPIPVDVSPPSPAITIDQLYQAGAGKIVLFDPVVAPAATTVPGQVLTEIWPASVDYQFEFQLIYDAANVFQTALCKITSTRMNFAGRRYFLPLRFATKDQQKADVSFNIQVNGGAGVFTNSMRCQINTPQFRFDGNTLLFNDSFSDTVPNCEVAW